MNLWELPWEDVIFLHILPLLDIRALLNMSITCQDFRHMIQDYFKQIKIFSIETYGPKISSAALDTLLGKLESCQSLNLRGCRSSLTDQILHEALPKNKTLQSIDLSDCITITNHALQTLAVSCTKLSYLSLSGCVWASPPAVSNIVLHCRHITHLDLSGCWGMTDDTVVAISLSCHR